jgi:predicted CoA-binding protein
VTDECEVPKFNAQPAEIAAALKTARTIAVVGASPKPEQPSYNIMAYLMHQGYKVIPVNPGQPSVLGEKCYASLTDIPVSVDIANIFLNPSNVPPVVDQAVAKGVQTVWMQSGIVHNEAAAKARKSGILVVMNKCIQVEHRAWKAAHPA